MRVEPNGWGLIQQASVHSNALRRKAYWLNIMCYYFPICVFTVLLAGSACRRGKDKAPLAQEVEKNSESKEASTSWRPEGEGATAESEASESEGSAWLLEQVPSLREAKRLSELLAQSLPVLRPTASEQERVKQLQVAHQQVQHWQEWSDRIAQLIPGFAPSLHHMLHAGSMRIKRAGSELGEAWVMGLGTSLRLYFTLERLTGVFAADEVMCRQIMGMKRPEEPASAAEVATGEEAEEPVVAVRTEAEKLAQWLWEEPPEVRGVCMRLSTLHEQAELPPTVTDLAIAEAVKAFIAVSSEVNAMRLTKVDRLREEFANKRRKWKELPALRGYLSAERERLLALKAVFGYLDQVPLAAQRQFLIDAGIEARCVQNYLGGQLRAIAQEAALQRGEAAAERRRAEQEAYPPNRWRKLLNK